ncbi:MAG: 23S rRNA (adenine(2503)-C(2))-methyltransferase RlmN [Bdellovibrio sp.]|jgi:23S rRNA (adenine2503-C2)-methyltransferase
METQKAKKQPRTPEKPSISPDGRRPWEVENPALREVLEPGEPVNFFSLTLDDLKAFLNGLGKEQFRAQQIYKWVYEQNVTDFDQMSNLSKTFRDELKGKLSFELPKVTSHLKSVDGTQKFLFTVKGGFTVEAVIIPSDDRLTLCVSSEVGCNMACKFCFTGKQKLKRRLSASEIVGQFLQAERLLPEGQRLTNIVFMGMGEPLDNPEAVFKSIEVLRSQYGRNFSRRKVTVSTSGLVPEMWRISAAHTRLAVSLNGYDDASRTSIMPINKKYPLEQLLEACLEYCRDTKDHVTFEYVLLKGITDQIEHARKLHALTRGIPCKVNIIPFNEHPGSEFERPSDETIERFHSELMRLGTHVLLRRTMGRDIFAACGQLTSEFENKPQNMDISNSNIGGNSVRNFSGWQPRV